MHGQQDSNHSSSFAPLEMHLLMKAPMADLYLVMSQPQMENGILLPTLQSALPFLDLHGTPRLEFHQSVFDELRENLMERVAVIAEGKEADRCVTIANRPFFVVKTILSLIFASLC